MSYQISASGEKVYHDAYTIQVVEEEHLKNFNYVAGMVPFLLNLVLDVSFLNLYYIVLHVCVCVCVCVCACAYFYKP